MPVIKRKSASEDKKTISEMVKSGIPRDQAKAHVKDEKQEKKKADLARPKGEHLKLDEDLELAHAIAGEFMEGISNNDHELVVQALMALITQIQLMDEMSDEEMK
jgi:hypothetical protein